VSGKQVSIEEISGRVGEIWAWRVFPKYPKIEIREKMYFMFITNKLTNYFENKSCSNLINII